MQETLEIICIALQGYALVFQKREEYIFGVLYEHLSNINYPTYLQKQLIFALSTARNFHFDLKAHCNL